MSESRNDISQNPITVRDGDPKCKTVNIPGLAETAVTHADATRPSLNLTVDGVISLNDLTALPTELSPKSGPTLLAIPGFETIKELGRGGMGVVFQARQIQLNRIVALKMVLSGAIASDADLTRIRAEARAVAALRHPNVVQIYDVGEADGLPYLSLEYCDSGSLGELIRGKPLDNAESAALLETLARGVHAAHRCRIIHRDLKPGNVLLNKAGEAGSESNSSEFESACPIRGNMFVPKISDFGLAKQLDGADDVTRSGAILGTPAYMAPEQASGKSRSVGPATDVYSLGVILYECLTGRVPFTADSPLETILQVQEQPPLRPSLVSRNVDQALEAICLKCLAKRPEDRYKSANDLAEDLAAYRRGDRVKAMAHAQTQLFRDLLRETRHTEVMARWGWVWIWQGPVIAVIFGLTDVLIWNRVESTMAYALLWGFGLAVITLIAWLLRFRHGLPPTPVEGQMGKMTSLSVVGLIVGGIICVLAGLPALKFLPFAILLIGIYVGCLAVLLGGSFYPLAAACLLTAMVLAASPGVGTGIFGLVFAAGLFFPGWRYARLTKQKQNSEQRPPNDPRPTLPNP